MSETIEDVQTWDEEEQEEEQTIVRRPRRRLLTPVTALLFALLLGAGGFIIGVEVEKGETSTSGGTRGAGRLAGLLGAAGAGAGGGTGATPGARSFGGGSAGATVGQVQYISGSDLYVTNPEGNTVKVLASGAHITRQVNSSVEGVHPGDTVIVQGAADAKGSIVASTVRASSSSGAGTALFGRSPNTGTGRATGSGEPALFGK